jgi:maltose-binding protein MalE
MVRRDAIASGRVLFWQIDSGELARLWHDFPVMPNQFYEKFGISSFPTAIAGNPSSIRLKHTFFVILSEQATGRTRQPAACDLLARMIDRDLSARHSVTSFNVGAVTGLMNEPIFAQHPVLPGMEALLDNGHTAPNSPAYKRLRDVLVAYMLEVERGEMEPALAVETAVTELKEQFGDQLVVEP